MSTAGQTASSVSETGPSVAAYFYRGRVQEEVLARLHHSVSSRHPLALLTGFVGSGKSLVLDVLGRDLRRDGCRVVKISLAAVDRIGFCRALAIGLECRVRAADSIERLWQSIADSLVANQYLQWPTAVLLDDADQASDGVVGLLVRLLHGCARNQVYTTMILTADRRGIPQVDTRLLDHASLRIELAPWEPDEVEEYLCGALDHAGVEEMVFERDAIVRLHSLALGQVRHICRLADLALAAAAGNGIHSIDASTIDAVAEETLRSVA